jgi:2-oxoisovalerate dehydrogenase E2 component (dihydrolipoyl transacylase)
VPEAVVRDFVVPDLGEGLEEATIVRWLVSEGDEVERNQPIVVVETAKAEVEIPSPHAGRILALGGREGETLRVGSLLVRFGLTEEGAHDNRGSRMPMHGTSTVKEQSGPVLVGYGPDATLDHSRRRLPGLSPRAGGRRPLAKPPVRKLARDLGVDLGSVRGTGPGGVVTRTDVEAAAAGRMPPPSPLPSTPDEVVPVRGVRARIAARMATSRAEIPEATCEITVDCSRLLEVRGALNAEAARRGHREVVTPFALIARFTVIALGIERSLNATWLDEGPAIRRWGAVHLGVAVATERGLLVPVLRDAQSLGTLALAERIHEVAAAARAGTLAPSDLAGSTFTVTNFGVFGLDRGIPVINHPEAAILGVGAVKARPWVVDGAVVARPTVTLTVAFDHRVCDGAEAGRFLSALGAMVEKPELSLLGS